jgi:hypothetical protein
MGASRRSDIQRQHLAYEAARIMAEQGEQEFERARRKAASRLGVTDRRSWPRNDEIQDALLQQRRLFDPQATHRTELRRLRGHALGAMRLFAAFAPRLVGPTLTGTADASTGVRLYLFAEGPEEVILILLDQAIPWQERERTLCYAGGRRAVHPAFHFVAGDIPVELVVLPVQSRRDPPLDAVSERPERGADLAEVERLIRNAEHPGD